MDQVIASVSDGLYSGPVALQSPNATVGSLGTTENDWSAPTTTATGFALLTPVDGDAAQQAGIQVNAGTVRAFATLPTTPTAETHRLTANGVQYRITNVRNWGAFYEMFLEVNG